MIADNAKIFSMEPALLRNPFTNSKLLICGMSVLIFPMLACGLPAIGIEDPVDASAPREVIQITSESTTAPVEIIPDPTSTTVLAAQTQSPAPTIADTPTPEGLVLSEIGQVPTTEYDPAGMSAGPGGRFVVLDDPSVIAAIDATWINGDDIVMGIEWNGEARAYPINQMAYHHIANDTVGGEPLLVTY